MLLFGQLIIWHCGFAVHRWHVIDPVLRRTLGCVIDALVARSIRQRYLPS